MTGSISVICVDDNALVADALQIRLRLEGGFDVVGVLSSADSLSEIAARLKPDVIVLDVDMPGKDSFTAVRELAQSSPNTRVLMLSGHVRKELVDRAFEVGAWGYVSKSGGTDSIIEAIRRVHNGEFAICPDVEAVTMRG
ncbi:MAG: response regulator transcription factor [Phycisphaerales bacterium]|nr:response regulator transcription factor [Phycisphaerales bacterium]